MSIVKSTSATLARLITIVGLMALSTQTLHAQQAQNGIASQTPRTLAEPVVGAVLSGPVPTGGPWIEFAFLGTGSSATGCSPADPTGAACSPSSGGNSAFGGTPPWTFTAPPGGAKVTVTDAFLRGDRFEIFDFGASIGTTSVPATTGACGDDPDPCLADPQVSHAVFSVSAGPHQITIKAIATVSPGAAYFRIDASPPQLDHWLCYDVKPVGRFRQRRVAISNQFENQNYIVLKPSLLCVPSTKKLLK